MYTNAGHAAGLDSNCRPRTIMDWVVTQGICFRANILSWGMPRDVSILEIRVKLADLGLVSFVRGKVA